MHHPTHWTHFTPLSWGPVFPPLQEATGYKLEVATVRRLEFENDTFAFGDKLIKKWYPGAEKVGPGLGHRLIGGKSGQPWGPVARCQWPSGCSGRTAGRWSSEVERGGSWG